MFSRLIVSFPPRAAVDLHSATQQAENDHTGAAKPDLQRYTTTGGLGQRHGWKGAGGYSIAVWGLRQRHGWKRQSGSGKRNQNGNKDGKADTQRIPGHSRTSPDVRAW
jgi:hypothetical protein